jgi:hypothetical protein
MKYEHNYDVMSFITVFLVVEFLFKNLNGHPFVATNGSRSRSFSMPVVSFLSLSRKYK